MFHPVRGSILFLLLILLATSASVIYVSTPHVLSEQKIIPSVEIAPKKERLGKYIVADLTDMTITLKDGTTTISRIPIISKGKPGSYYETPGGVYINDYKEPNHFSSIGHVYMPFSVHIFGNFFIHGIPYYPDGTRVSSTFSGGCIRLSDENAEVIYNFIERGTPIIITQGTKEDFDTKNSSSEPLISAEMTRYMASAISLEFLTQDDEIIFNGEITTRRKMLHDLLILNDDTVSLSFATYYGRDLFAERMNEKAKSIGLNNTLFTSTNEPALTTNTDFAIFMKYIADYKSYLLQPSI